VSGGCKRPQRIITPLTAALARHLRHTIDDDRYPLSPRLAPLQAIPAKLPRLNRHRVEVDGICRSENAEHQGGPRSY
jgi:hypothetical protein